MTLSVVVSSYDASGTLGDCLESLTAQPEASQIIVTDCSETDPALELQSRFPTVQFLHFDELKTTPELRWTALDQLRGDVVGVVEARSLPAPDWCAKMLEAHEANPDVDVIAGPVADNPASPALETAMYFAEYWAYAPPPEVGRAERFIEANFSIKRSALEARRSFLATGEWETFLQDDLKTWISDAGLQFRHTGMSFGQLCGQRYFYGINYAAARAAIEGRAKALVYAALSPLLPVVMTYRNWRGTRQKPVARRFARAVPWLVFLNSLWAAGELVGYLFGPTRKKYIY